MNPMRKIVMFLAILVLAAGSLHAQRRILKDAAAAAGGTAIGASTGTELGKGVANLFGKVDAATNKAAAVGSESKTPARLEPVPQPASGEAQPPDSPSAPSPPAVRQWAHRAAAPAPSPQRSYPVPVLSSPPAPQITKDDLANLEAGLKRSQLVAQLGTPAARVFIPEDGYLKELYLFSGGGMHLGTVELSDGSVCAVSISRF